MTVGYTNVNYKRPFSGLVAGETQSTANSLMSGVKATGKLQMANIRKMQVVIDYGD